MKIGTTPVTLTAAHAGRIAELLDYLSDMAEAAEDSLEGDELTEHQRERISANHWVRELREATNRPPAPASTGSC